MSKPLKIDIHTHILPKEWPNLRDKYGYGEWIRLEHQNDTGCAHMMKNDTFFRTIEANCWDPGVRLAECDTADVDVQVLSTVPVMFSYWAKPADTHDLSRFLNDHIAETAATDPSRFVALGTVPMQDADLATRELERCIKDLGMPGIQIGSHVNGLNLDAPELFPVFEAAQDLGAALFVHPWDMLARERMPKYWLPWLVGMPAETTMAICSMIFGGVFERLPKLRVAFAHGGGAFPFTIGRIQHGFDVRPDLCAVDNAVSPRDYLGRFWLDSLVHDTAALKYMIELVGAERIALGSDYPFPLGEHHPGELIESLDLEPETRDLLLHGAALEWLDLPLSRFEARTEGEH
ncbi:MAG: amidohydrolase family protein [Gammaproteobacteria bacterium]|nr:amidohydrolase family protein [Gammaproteobacteria bacterium]